MIIRVITVTTFDSLWQFAVLQADKLGVGSFLGPCLTLVIMELNFDCLGVGCLESCRYFLEFRLYVCRHHSLNPTFFRKKALYRFKLKQRWCFIGRSLTQTPSNTVYITDSEIQVQIDRTRHADVVTVEIDRTKLKSKPAKNPVFGEETTLKTPASSHSPPIEWQNLQVSRKIVNESPYLFEFSSIPSSL